MNQKIVDHMLIRSRWDGLVVFTWILACVTFAVSVWMIAKFGIIEIPTYPGRSYSRTETHYIPVVWGYAIGLIVSAVLLASLFSMVNSAYKNSCDQLVVSLRTEDMLKSQFGIEQPENTDVSEPASPEWGLRVEWVNHDSPLRWALHAGCVIISINGTPANNVKQASSLIIDGTNVIDIITMQGRRVTKEVNMTKGQFGVRAVPAKLPPADSDNNQES